jgi:RNA polymerase sigma-70 factor, ECF subfamily
MPREATLRIVTGGDDMRPTLAADDAPDDAARAGVSPRAAAGTPAASAPSESRGQDPAGRPPSFDALYRQHYPRVLGLCRRLLRHAAQAEDATQEVFMRAYRAFRDYDGAQPFAPWVLKIASNYCVDVVRRRAREAEVFGSEEAELRDVESDDPGAVTALISAENAAEVRAAMDRLPDKHRVPLVLAYYNESSYDDIAATLDITRNHVGVLILRGKQALRRELLGGRASDGTRSNRGEST